MGDPTDHPITMLLSQVTAGDVAARNELFEVVYGELRIIAKARRDRGSDAALQTTGLVNEAFIRLAQQERVDWQNRSHFFSIASMAMRRIVIDHARRLKRAKRGGGKQPVLLEDAPDGLAARADDILAVDEALGELKRLSPRQAQIVEYKVFAGLTSMQVAELLGVSTRTVDGDWAAARAWLSKVLKGD